MPATSKFQPLMIKQAPVALIAFVATAAVVAHIGLSAYRDHALPTAAAGQCYAFELAAEAYRKANRSWPPDTSNADAVAALMGDPKVPSKKRQDFLLLTSNEQNVPLFVKPDPPGSDTYVALDVWNTPLQFDASSGKMVVTSAGPDRQPGTADDITSADLPPEARANTDT